MHRQTVSILATVIAGVLLLGAPLAAQADPRGKRRSDEIVSSASTVNIPGPKRTVAVARFATKTDFLYAYGQTDVGAGLAAMLATALVDSDQFIVVERATLSDALEEQQLKDSGLVSGEAGPSLGGLIGADFLIQGAVTEFSESAKGGGFGVGVARAGVFRNLGLSPQFRRGTVGLDLRVVDTTSGEIVASYSVVETIKSKAVRLRGDVEGVSLSQNAFSSTPIGKAARAAIDQAVARFAREAAQRPWSGRVVDFEAGEVAINAGSNSGVRVGDAFAIKRITRVLTDPETGRVLGKRSANIGQIRVFAVEQGLAFGRFEAWMETDPQRGDLVVQP